MKRLVFFALFLVPAALSGQSADVARAVGSITASDFYNKVGVISADSMMGRYTPSPELDQTAEWVAEQFRRAGLKPGGDGGSYIQRYAIEEVGPDYEGSVFRISGGGSLAFGADVISGFGVPSGQEITGGLAILAGSPPHGGLDGISGRHLILILPEEMANAGRRAQMRLLGSVMAAGPASLITVSSATDAEWQQALDSQRPSTRTPWQDSRPSRYPTMLTVREGSLSRLLAQAGVELPAVPADVETPGVLTLVPDVELTIQAKSKVLSEMSAPNTVGILEGSDPVLKNEYLVFSGHMDHVGVRTPNAEGDSIANGADDDASGTVAVVELAQAFSMLATPPKRSIIFLTVSGEERGLWGSAYFASRPSVPIEDIVADLNADMISRNQPDSIVVIGKEHSDLGSTLNRIAAAHPELNMVASDDIWPEENFYGRSDHFNFARRGVPILFFFCGTTEDYHQVTDELEKIDTSKAARVAQIMFYLGMEVANNPERPRWDPQSYADIVGGNGR